MRVGRERRVVEWVVVSSETTTREEESGEWRDERDALLVAVLLVPQGEERENVEKRVEGERVEKREERKRREESRGRASREERREKT